MREKYNKREILSLFLEEISSLKKEKENLSQMLLDLYLEAPEEIKKEVVDFCSGEIHRLERKERALLSFVHENIAKGGYFYAAFADYRDLYPSSSSEEDEEDDFEVVEEEEEEEE